MVAGLWKWIQRVSAQEACLCPVATNPNFVPGAPRRTGVLSLCRLGSVSELSEGHHETTVTTQAATVARHCAVPSLSETWETRSGV